MRLFEIGRDRLVQFRHVPPGPDLYERDIQDLLWSNLEALTGVRLLPVASEPRMANGLRPDILALDVDGYIHVIEVKRGSDREQIAQCLEYAGQAAVMSLGELEAMYPDGPDAFNSGWTAFTGTQWPRQVQKPPRLVLVAGDFDDQTSAALKSLSPDEGSVRVLSVKVYEDLVGRRILTVAGDHERDDRPQETPTLTDAPDPQFRCAELPTNKASNRGGKRGVIQDLIHAGLIEVNTRLACTNKGVTYWATVTASGLIKIEDGGEPGSPSATAAFVFGWSSANGLKYWRMPNGPTLAELKQELKK